jgi:hypothetical protein
MDYWEWIEQAVILAILEHDAITARVDELEAALCEISNMCIGELTMSYRLDANCIGELIWEATGMANPELNDSVEAKL